MKKLVFVGSGAVAAEQVSYMELADYYYDGDHITIKGFVDFKDSFDKNNQLFSYSQPWLGNDDSYQLCEDDFFVVAIDNPQIRTKVVKSLENKRARFINLVHPSCIIAKNSTLGIGNIISPNSMVGPGAVMGSHNILTSSTLISHHCQVGDCNSFSTAILCGDVVVGNGNTFNIRSTVIPSIKIGDNCIIQAGMVVDKNVPDGTTVFYKYKERILAIPKD